MRHVGVINDGRRWQLARCIISHNKLRRASLRYTAHAILYVHFVTRFLC